MVGTPHRWRMSRSDKNKALVHRAWKLADNPDGLDEVYAPDVVWHEPDQETVVAGRHS